jgi:GPH family glycoside/pentoside/hexuronide:cation symporter
MTTSSTIQRLTTKAKLLYGIGDFGNAMVNSAVVFYLLIFYTDAALIPPAIAGTALMIGKIWDAVNDPLFGWVSDRTTSRFGKRRVYMIFGALPLALTIALLWFVPQGMSNTGFFLWIAISFMLFDTFNTLTSVPYYALTAELTSDYDERSSLTAFRMILGVPGYIMGAALTLTLVGLFASKMTGFRMVGIIFGVIAAFSLWISAAGIKERQETNQSQSKMPAMEAFLATFRNRPFVRLIVAYLIANLGFVLVQTLLAYFMTYQLGMEAQVPLAMLLLLGSVMLFLFPWKKLSERMNKGPAYALGLGIGGLCVAATFFLPHEPTPIIYVIAFMAGMGFSSNWVFPWAMVPDVVEYDQLETNEHRSGMYYGVWGFTSKLTNALGAAIAGWVLQLSGYIPNVEQNSLTLQGIRAFFGPIPAVILAISLPMLIWYPITRQKHAQIRAQLAKRQSQPELPV